MRFLDDERVSFFFLFSRFVFLAESAWSIIKREAEGVVCWLSSILRVCWGVALGVFLVWLFFCLVGFFTQNDLPAF